MIDSPNEFRPLIAEFLRDAIDFLWVEQNAWSGAKEQLTWAKFKDIMLRQCIREKKADHPVIRPLEMDDDIRE